MVETVDGQFWSGVEVRRQKTEDRGQKAARSTGCVNCRSQLLWVSRSNPHCVERCGGVKFAHPVPSTKKAAYKQFAYRSRCQNETPC